MKQTSFAMKENFKKDFGGDLLFGHRKTARPLSTKTPMHFVLKSEKARGKLAFVNHHRHLEKLIAKVSKEFHLKIYDFAINFNHIHLIVRLPNRDLYRQWIRALTSAIVGLLSARTGEKLFDFFTLRPYSKILSWGRQFRLALDYIIKIKWSLFGIFRPRKKKTSKRAAVGRTH